MSNVGEGGGASIYRNIPLVVYAQARAEGSFRLCRVSASGGGDETPFLGGPDPQAYALEITGDSMELVFRDNNIVIILPDANIRRSGWAVVTGRWWQFYG